MWFFHFKELLNTDCDIDSDILRFVEFNMNNYDSSCDTCTCTKNESLQLNSKFTIEEVLNLFLNCQTEQSAGVDGICSERLKNCSRFLVPFCI